MSISCRRLLSSFSVLPLNKKVSHEEILEDLPLGDEFQRDHLAAALPASLVDFSEGAFSDRMEYVILIHLDFQICF